MIDNYINHIAMVIDGSGSMLRHEQEVVTVADQQVAYLAERSKETGQETRVSLYVFEDRLNIKCHAYDKDVLRLPSLKNLYHARGRETPLIQATLQAVRDLEKTATLYGDHSFLVYVLTDGQENTGASSLSLQQKIVGLPEEWTLACFVPDQLSKREAKQYGFPADNIAIWNTDAGVSEIGDSIRQATDSYFTMRSTGTRGTKNLFTLNTGAVKKTAVSKALSKLGPGQFRLLPVKSDTPIAPFIEKATKRPYKIGEAFYQLTVPVKVQAQKEIALYHRKDHSVYRGSDARTLLGLPDYEVKVQPAECKDFDIFVQSTSVNRKLLAGTKLLLLS